MLATQRQKLIEEQEKKLEGMLNELDILEGKELQNTVQYKKKIEAYEKGLDYYEKLVTRHEELLEKE